MPINVQKNKILLIEDDANISGPLKWALESRNYSVNVISNGIDAINHIQRAEKEDYNLVLIDLMLPGINGWEILIKIKSLKNTQNWSVIMLTAIDDEASEARALYDGADDYITKPFSMNVLIARIEANIRKNTLSSKFNIDDHFVSGEIEELTKREREILNYVAKGYSNKDIAQLAFINEITVGNHIRHIFQKLKVNSRTQAALLALKYNIAQ